MLCHLELTTSQKLPDSARGLLVYLVLFEETGDFLVRITSRVFLRLSQWG
jgi:hypothetical protein